MTQRSNFTKVFYLLSPLVVGISSSGLTFNAMKVFETINKPNWAPNKIVFPVAWTILYILMGIAAMEVYKKEDSNDRTKALLFHFIQLILNFFWSIIFFNMGDYFFALIWMLLLIVCVIRMMLHYRKVSIMSFYLSVPYVMWSCFAAYLNFVIYRLN